MSKPTAMAIPPPPSSRTDPSTEGLRQGAPRVWAHAIEADVETWEACDTHECDARGRHAVVRHGALPLRVVPRPVWGR